MNIENFLVEGQLDGPGMELELRRQIEKLKNSLKPKDFIMEVNELIFNFVNISISFLSEKKMLTIIPEFIKVVYLTVSSFGIKNVKIPTNIITDLIERIPSDKTNRKKMDKRQAIFNAAMMVFSTKGFHEAHVDEIASLAGVSKGTIYRYFKSKDEILLEFINEKNQLLADGLGNILKKDSDILELIKEAIAYYLDFCEKNRELYKILIHAPTISKNINRHFYNFIVSHLHIIKSRILILIRAGSLKSTDFYTVFYGIFGFIDGVIQKWIRRNCDYPLVDELPIIIEVLFYGFVGDNVEIENSKNEKKSMN